MAVLALGLAPGTVRADLDSARAEAFYGAVESLPGTGGWVGDWTIGGRTVRVEPGTRIEQEHGRPAVGAQGGIEPASTDHRAPQQLSQASPGLSRRTG